MIIEKNIKGKKYLFKFTTLTMFKVCELKQIEFHQYDDFCIKEYPMWINYLLRSALDVGSKGETKMSEYEMDDLIETMDQPDLQDIMNSYFESNRNLADKYGIKINAKEKKN